MQPFVKVAPATFPHRSLSPGAQGGPAGGAEGAKLEELEASGLGW